MRAYLSLLIPAAVFQSVIVGGAYGTGREVVEFISSFGALGGLFAIGLIAISFGLILAASFEFARTYRAWDYRHFLRELLGRGWVAYEILFAALLVIILAVTAAAAVTVLQDAFQISKNYVLVLLFGLVILLSYFGRETVKRTLAIGAVLLSAFMLIYCVLIMSAPESIIYSRITTSSISPGWWLSGLKFAVYNSALIPVIVFCASDLEDRFSTVGAAMLAGCMGVFPALALHLTFIAGSPQVLTQSIPTYWMLEHFGFTNVIPIFVIILFITIVQTGVGVLQGLNERLDGWYRDTRGVPLSRTWHAFIAGAVLLASVLMSRFGIVALVAEGYGTIAWGFFIVFTVPILTLGVYKIWRTSRRPP